MAAEITIIADNAGGITLQVETDDTVWQHHYDGSDDFRQCAKDIRGAEYGDDVNGWDGNEMADNGLLYPTDDEIRNGGYRVLTVGDVNDWGDDDGWGNVCDLRDALSETPHPNA